MAKRPFGISTQRYRTQRLTRAHLLDIAAHGFEAVEIVAARTHVDFHHEPAIADLQQWLGEAGLALHTVCRPGAGNRGRRRARVVHGATDSIEGPHRASAHKGGDVADAIETVVEHLTARRVPIAEDRTTEVMRHGRAAIDWPAALTTLQKVGVQRLNQGDARAREGGA